MKKKIIIVCVVTVLFILLAVIAVAFFRLKAKSSAIDDDYSAVYENAKYQNAVQIEDIGVITQDVSCGYAVVEMFSAWDGGSITEETLYNEYGKVVTSTGKSFCREMNKQFPNRVTTMHKYLKNTELIDLIYDSLLNGVPVPIEWAAKYEGEWTLHYSLVVGMDIPNDTIVVANPYGYYENISLKEFLERTRFDAYENMSLFLKFGFAFDVFEKNTVFIVK